MQVGVIAEDRADTDSLKAIINNICKKHSVRARKILAKGYSGWGEMFEKGVGQLRAFLDLGCTCLIVCFDADGPDPEPRRSKVVNELFAKLKAKCGSLPLIPVRVAEITYSSPTLFDRIRAWLPW